MDKREEAERSRGIVYRNPFAKIRRSWGRRFALLAVPAGLILTGLGFFYDRSLVYPGLGLSALGVLIVFVPVPNWLGKDDHSGGKDLE